MIAFLLCCFTAFATVSPTRVTPVVTVRAEVSSDLRTISGTFDAPEMDGLKWVDLLSKLPNPTSDRIQHRTFPGPKESGKVWMEPPPASGRSRSFNAVLPRRFGAAGFVPGRGLFANGLWHPHAMRNGRLAQVQWDVVLALPEGATAGYGDDLTGHESRLFGDQEPRDVGDIFGQGDPANRRSPDRRISSDIVIGTDRRRFRCPGTDCIDANVYVPRDRDRDRARPRIAAFELI